MAIKKIDSFTPPKGVRAAAKRGLELRSKFGRGGTAVGIARARDLSNGKSISASTIRRMNSFFARHAVDKRPGWSDVSNPSNGYIAHLLWGGDAGRSWASRLSEYLDKTHKEYISEQDDEFFFGEEESGLDTAYIEQALKHMRGRHDQRSHAWNRGMGKGGNGTSAGASQQGNLEDTKPSRRSLVLSNANPKTAMDDDFLSSVYAKDSIFDESVIDSRVLPSVKRAGAELRKLSDKGELGDFADNMQSFGLDPSSDEDWQIAADLFRVFPGENGDTVWQSYGSGPTDEQGNDNYTLHYAPLQPIAGRIVQAFTHIAVNKNNKSIEINNQDFGARGNSPPAGIGHTMLMRQAAAAQEVARRIGYTVKAKTYAVSSRDREYNGYHTWPKIGYSFSIIPAMEDYLKLYGFSDSETENTTSLFQSDKLIYGKSTVEAWSMLVGMFLKELDDAGVIGRMTLTDPNDAGVKLLQKTIEDKRQKSNKKSTSYGDEFGFDENDIEMYEKAWKELFHKQKKNKKSISEEHASQNILESLSRVSERLDRLHSTEDSIILQRLKHLRGRHDQRDHAWNRGMGRGGGGTDAAVSHPNKAMVNAEQYRENLVTLQQLVNAGKMTYHNMRNEQRKLRGYEPLPPRTRKQKIQDNKALAQAEADIVDIANNRADSPTNINSQPMDESTFYLEGIRNASEPSIGAPSTENPITQPVQTKDEIAFDNAMVDVDYLIGKLGYTRSRALQEVFDSFRKHEYPGAYERLRAEILRANNDEYVLPENAKQAPPVLPKARASYVPIDTNRETMTPQETFDTLNQMFTDMVGKEIGKTKKGKEVQALRSRVAVGIIQSMKPEEQMDLLRNPEIMKQLRETNLAGPVLVALGIYGSADARLETAKYAQKEDNDLFELLKKTSLEAKLLNLRDDEIATAIVKLHVGNIEGTLGSHIMQAVSQIGPNKNVSPDKTRSFFANGVIPPQPHPRIVAALDKAYQETQDKLKSLGLTEIRLFRGGKYQGGLPQEPWSTDKMVARQFGGYDGDVRTAAVPIEYIWSSHWTSPRLFLATEQEYLVLAQSMYANNPDAAQIIAGKPVLTDLMEEDGGNIDDVSNYLNQQDAIFRLDYPNVPHHPAATSASSGADTSEETNNQANADSNVSDAFANVIKRIYSLLT